MSARAKSTTDCKRSFTPLRVFPRRSRCFLILAIISLLQVLYFLLVTENLFDALSYSELEKLINSEAENSEELIKSIESKLSQVQLSDDYNKYWKYYTDLSDYEINSFDYNDYLTTRSKKHFFDPRVTYAIYLNHIKKKFQSENPSNSKNSPEITIPFSWQDWVDLSPLNKYVEMGEDDKPTCKDILEKGLDYNPNDKSKPDVNQHASTCINNEQYQGSTNKSLLPGFNFIAQSKKATFKEKLIHAKSFMLAAAPIPNSILFLSENGTFEAVPTEDKTMFQSGLFDEYIEEHKAAITDVSQEMGPNDPNTLGISINPIYEFNTMRGMIPGRQAELNFHNIFTSENNYEYNLPLESFIYNYDEIISNYESSPDPLTTKEQRHLESLKFSKNQGLKQLKKSFSEVNIVWPASNNGHKLTENGGHYDYRFFNGFLSESQINQFDDVSEKRKIILHRMLHTWLQFSYNEGLVSFLAHGTLLSWYWDGLVFEWDNDIDVQMPIKDLDKFSMNYNGSMIVQDLNFGFHKYYVHVGNSITHRTKGNGRNNIDARFIDVDSGMYIDITGLAITGSAKVPTNYIADYNNEKAVKEANAGNAASGEETKAEIDDVNKVVPNSSFEEVDDVPVDPNVPVEQSNSNPTLRKRLSGEHANSGEINNILKKPHGGVPRNTVSQRKKEPDPTDEAFERNKLMKVLNCRNNHFYKFDDISPLRLSQMEGAPALIPRDFRTVLKSEYSGGLRKLIFNKHIYLADLRLWVPIKEAHKAVKKIKGSNVGQSAVLPFYKQHDVEMLMLILENGDLLKEFYLTHDETRQHVKEMEILNNLNDNKQELTDDLSLDYGKLIEQYQRYKKPLRKDYFNYIDDVDNLENNKRLKLKTDDFGKITKTSDGYYFIPKAAQNLDTYKKLLKLD